VLQSVIVIHLVRTLNNDWHLVAEIQIVSSSYLKSVGCSLFIVVVYWFHNLHDDETVISKEFPEYFHFSHTILAQHQLIIGLGLEA